GQPRTRQPGESPERSPPHQVHERYCPRLVRDSLQTTEDIKRLAVARELRLQITCRDYCHDLPEANQHRQWIDHRRTAMIEPVWVEVTRRGNVHRRCDKRWLVNLRRIWQRSLQTDQEHAERNTNE